MLPEPNESKGNGLEWKGNLKRAVEADRKPGSTGPREASGVGACRPGLSR